jgi:hypothetical protein
LAALKPDRDLRLDFFRGLALFFIFVDHIPDNALSYFTLQAVGFCDAAEVFIFISGYTAALVYGRTMQHQGVVFAGAHVWRRVWQLYVAHIFLFVIFTAEVSWTILRFNNPMYAEEMRVGDFLAEPHIAIINALALRFQPTFLDILPLYIVLLAVFPLILLLLRWSTWAAVLPSLALYLAVQRLGLSLKGYPAGHTWFFNPLAWQFLFVIGAALGYAQVVGRRLYGGAAAFRLALPTFLICFVIALSWLIHGVYDAFPGLLLRQLWPINKNNLSPLRLIDFLALAVVVVHFVPRDAGFLRWRASSWVVLCGQQSLQIFCLGILLSVLAHFVLAEYEGGLGMQLAANLAGVILMIATASLLAWYKTMDQAERTRAGTSTAAQPRGRAAGIAE